jgi:hypothetical protein
MAVQIGFADDWLHQHYLFRLFITGAGIPPEDGAVADAGNTGNGEMTRIHGLNATVTETITVTLTSASAFDVVGSVTGALASGTVGVPYTSAVIEFELDAGTTPFIATDEFTVAMVENPLETAGTKWAIKDESATEALNAELYLEAPGANGIGVAPLHYFGIDTPSANPAYYRLVSSNEFNIGNSFYTQVGYSGGNSPCMQGWEFKTKYWFIADENRFFWISRVWDRYFVMSAGILNSYATEAQWPQPHYIAGHDYTARHWETGEGYSRNFPDGSSAGAGSTASFMRVFRPDLLWDNVNTHYRTGAYSTAGDTTADIVNIWPYGDFQNNELNYAFNPLTTTWAGNMHGLFPGPEAGALSTYPLIPIQVYRKEGASQALFGTIDGVFATSGGYLAGNFLNVADFPNHAAPSRLAPEDIITVGPDQYLCIPTIPWSTRMRAAWVAFKLE